MPTQEYRNAAGKRLPGVTTVNGNLGWNRNALMAWSNREGLAGRDINAPGGRAKKAADVGTAGHDMIEAHIHRQDPETVSSLGELDEDSRLLANKAFGSFLRWFEGTRIRVVGTELWGVDETYQTGFCPDGIGVLGLDPEDDGGIAPVVQGKLTPELEGFLIDFARRGYELCLLDWKTGKGVYAEHIIQVSAYSRLVQLRLSERAGFPITFSNIIILSVRPNGLFKHYDYPADMPEIEDAWRIFTMLRWIHSKKWEINGLI